MFGGVIPVKESLTSDLWGADLVHNGIDCKSVLPLKRGNKEGNKKNIAMNKKLFEYLMSPLTYFHSEEKNTNYLELKIFT